LELAALEALPPFIIAPFRKKLSRLRAEADRLQTIAVLSEPRPLGAKKYPGLRELILALEKTAQELGGAFAVHRKLGAKGSLVEALDWLRVRILSETDTKHLADFLPAPSRHPVAVYERVLRAARNAPYPLG
jgi:hypothetical protein